MGKLIWLAFGIFVVVALIKENGGIDGWIEPAKPQRQGPLVTCSKLSSYREISDCMARNCLFDQPELNAPQCNIR